MQKGFLIAVVALGCAIAADQHYSYGFYTDGALAMIGQMRHSFHW